MKTAISSIFLIISLYSPAERPKLTVKEADGNKISKESINAGAPTVVLKDGNGYTVESFDVCMKTMKGTECFSQKGSTIASGAKDDLKLLQPGQKFCIKNVKVRENATGKVRKLCRHSYKVV